MDGAYYVRILEDHLILNARNQFDQCWRLQQDNNPKHNNRIVEKFLGKEVQVVIDRSSNSPDVNLIVNLWSIIKHRVEKRRPTDLKDSYKFLHEEWDKIHIVVLAGLIKSVKSRCLALIESKGERINN